MSFQYHSFLIGQVWVPLMHFYMCPILCKSTLESGQEARIVQIDFSAEFERFNHHGRGILYKLYSVGIIGYVLSIFIKHSFY